MESTWVRVSESARSLGSVERQHSAWVGSALLAVVGLAGVELALRPVSPVPSDGSAALPLIALTGVVAAAVRWRPDVSVAPSRDVTMRTAVLVAGTAGVLLIIDRWASSGSLDLRGPLVTLAIVGGYLAFWGYRRVSLMRTLLVLSLIAWMPIAEAVHEFVRRTLEQPSATIYQQLARLGVFGIADEPWRLFTATLNRGSLVVVTTSVLAVTVFRWRLTVGMLVKLFAASLAALVVHHVVVLASSVNEYSPTDTVQLATNPVLEIAIGAGAVMLLARMQGNAAPMLGSPLQHHDEGRDPVIFSASRTSRTLAAEVLLLCPLLPLLEVLLDG
jgi:hypothetical protein